MCALPQGAVVSADDALAVAEGMAAAGVPIVLVRPDGDGGYVRPRDWPGAPADPTVIRRWRPGWQLAAVTGVAFDVLDIDPRHGGDGSLAALVAALGAPIPAFGEVATPSGGWHLYVPALGLGSPAPIGPALPGLDLKGGRPDGSGRGLATLPPTIRKGDCYRWLEVPNLRVLSFVGAGDLAAVVSSFRPSAPPPMPVPERPGGDRDRARVVPVIDLIADDLARRTEGRHNATIAAGNRAGSLLAGHGRLGPEVQDYATAQLLAAAQTAAPGKRPADLLKTVEFGMRGGARSPERLSDRRRSNGVR
jgi:hypothetical protein